MITVTKTFIPPFDEYQQQVKRAFDNEWLTNRGQLVIELEDILRNYLKVKNIGIMTNGTLPLQIAMKLFGKGGEVITTPFSYVATTAAIVWENCKPVFVDIHPDYLTIDETKIEAAVTSKTTAILATHVFGNPCHVQAIEAIAKKHNLTVVYDAAHCFGVNYNGQSVFNYGDISTCSFHATKLFHTAEGGAFFCNDDAIFHKMFYSHNFGHNGPLAFHGIGINGKISELQAAMGLAIFPHMPRILKERKAIVDYYNTHIVFSKLKPLKLREGTEWNYAYYPVVFESETALLEVEQILNENGIIPRRYFYPSLNTIDFSKGPIMPVSERIASCVLCLPLYVGLETNDLQRICGFLNA
jgi:dTDP-4-amino-4,6-dideoxygalactose transaminase